VRGHLAELGSVSAKAAMAPAELRRSIADGGRPAAVCGILKVLRGRMSLSARYSNPGQEHQARTAGVKRALLRDPGIGPSVPTALIAEIID